ncbi:phosphopantetheine-binding protein [Streptomyces sp. NPDC051183]|uniref:phosphopantetheine-binding protein n=1 Tax=unclassified Streptomyces TaxID=2593676 RepID=UPI00341E80CF
MYALLADLLVREFGIAPEAVHPQARVRDIQLDSLALLEISTMITDRTGLWFDEASVTYDSTLESVARCFLPEVFRLRS